jgi:DNA polymerase
MVIGEAPGQQDDRVGLPFQGRAGVLLDAMLGAVGIQTGTAVYFSNLIKCRPLGNRTPTPQEAAACLPYLQRQIDILQPRAILVLGKLAAQSLLGLDTDLDEIRGRIHHLRTESGRQIPVVATYHPASLLSRSQHKADAWRDLNLARSAISGAAKSEAATDGVRS